MNLNTLLTTIGSLSCIVSSYAQQQLFTTVGTSSFTTHPSVIELTVEAIGGGGGGGRAQGTGCFLGICTDEKAASGGGGGAYILSFVPVTGGTTYNVGVGAGGYNNSNGTEAHGGDSWFDISTSTIARAQGGLTDLGNGQDNSPNVPGGSAASSFARDLTGYVGTSKKFSGGQGGTGSDANNVDGGGGGGAAGSAGNGGNGGDDDCCGNGNSPGGTAGPGNFLNNLTASGVGGVGSNDGATGGAGTNYGGGGGGSSSGSTTYRSGGPGAQGIVLLVWSELHSYACSDTVLTLTGSNLINVTDVTFNGVPVPFTAVSGIQIDVQQPTTTGNFIVTTAYGRATLPYTTTVIVNAVPNSIVCEGTPVTLSGSGSGNYSWSHGITDGVAFPALGGNMTYSVTGSSFGCSVTASYTVTANPAPPASISGPFVYCIGGNTTITASGGTNYVWNDASSSTTESITVTAGNYIVTVTGSNGCTDTALAVIVESPNPIASIAAPPIFCEGTTAILTASGGTNYLWSNASSSNTTTISAGGNYTVTVTDINGCSSTASSIVTESPQLGSFTLADTVTNCYAQPVTLDATTANASSYLWSTNESTPTITASTSGVYTVTVTNSCGTQTHSVEAVVEVCACDFVLPSAFTPNGDATNDDYKIAFLCQNISSFTMRIYNRWGEKVFESNDYTIGWDGKYKGDAQPTDTYSVYIDVDYTESNGEAKRLSKISSISLLN